MIEMLILFKCCIEGKHITLLFIEDLLHFVYLLIEHNLINLIYI